MFPSDKEPLVTVVVHTYNHEKYIAECLDGIISQDFFSYMRILIIDDSSRDTTLNICREYQKSYPERIILIALPENEMSRGLVVGIKHLQSIESKYVAWCDGDDYWIDSSKISKQIEILETSPKVGVVHSNFIFLDNESGNLEFRERSPSDILKSSRFKGGMDMVEGNHIKHSTAVILRAAINFEFVGGARNIYAGDWLICVSATLKLGVHFIPEITTVARFTKMGVWNGSNSEKNRLQKELVRWYCAAYLPDSELRESFRRKVITTWFRDKVANSNAYKLARPAVSLARRIINFSH